MILTEGGIMNRSVSVFTNSRCDPSDVSRLPFSTLKHGLSDIIFKLLLVPENTLTPRIESDGGSVILRSDLQPSNALSPIYLRFGGKLILLNFACHSNAFSPMANNESGSDICRSLYVGWHVANAPSHITSVPSFCIVFF